MADSLERIPLTWHDIHPDDVGTVVAVLKSDRLSMGARVEAFEEDLVAYVGARYAAAVNSGTSALHLSVRSLGLCLGDEAVRMLRDHLQMRKQCGQRGGAFVRTRFDRKMIAWQYGDVMAEVVVKQ